MPSSTFVIIVLIFFGLIWYVVYSEMKHHKLKARLKDEYAKALRSGDKQKALEAGRKYYAKLRGGRLTIYDEQAITNDLSTMK